jgi:nucleotide-binding universal stress UspA family protein
MLVRPDRPASYGAVALAWKNSLGAARALIAAAPLLAKATRAVVLAAPDEETDAGEADLIGALHYLGWHGVRAELRRVEPGHRRPAEAVMDAALAVDAGFLVMGAFGHSRAHEAVFGGFTRDVLRERPLSVVLAP